MFIGQQIKGRQLDLDDLSGPLQPKPFCDSMKDQRENHRDFQSFYGLDCIEGETETYWNKVCSSCLHGQMDDIVRAPQATKSLQLKGHRGRKSALLGRSGRETAHLYVPGYFTRQRKTWAWQTQPAGGERHAAARSGNGAIRDGRGSPAGVLSRPSCPGGDTTTAEAPRHCRPRCAADVPGPGQTRSPRSAARGPRTTGTGMLRATAHGDFSSGPPRRPRPQRCCPQAPVPPAAARCGPSPWQRNRHRPAIRRTGSGTGARRKRRGAGCTLIRAWLRVVPASCWPGCVGVDRAVTLRRGRPGRAATRRSSAVVCVCRETPRCVRVRVVYEEEGSFCCSSWLLLSCSDRNSLFYLFLFLFLFCFWGKIHGRHGASGLAGSTAPISLPPASLFH